MTVPSGAKSGILVLCGSFWGGPNHIVNFSEPSGDGIISVTKIYDGYPDSSLPNLYANIHIATYAVSLKSGGSIAVRAAAEGNIDLYKYPTASMILLY